MSKQYEIVDSTESLQNLIDNVKKAQKEFSTFSQEKVDKIFLAAAPGRCGWRRTRPRSRGPHNRAPGACRNSPGDSAPRTCPGYAPAAPR